MKKLLKLVAASMMLVGLAACENGPTPTPGPTPEEQEQALAQAKQTAIGALEAYVAGKDEQSYTSDALEAILLEVNAGEAAINAATDVFSVNTALNAAKAAIDTVAPSEWKIGLHAFLDSTSLDCSDIDFDSFEAFEKVEFSVEEDEEGEYGFLYVGGENSEYAGISVLYDCLLSGWSLVDADEESADYGYISYEFRTGFNAEGDYLDVAIKIVEEGSLYEWLAEVDAGSYIYISQGEALSAEDTAEMVNTLLGEGVVVEIPVEEDDDDTGPLALRGTEPEADPEADPEPETEKYVVLKGLGYPEEAFIDEDVLAAIGDYFLVDYETGNAGEDMLNAIAADKYFAEMGAEEAVVDSYTDMYNIWWYDEHYEEEVEDPTILVALLEMYIGQFVAYDYLPADLALLDDENPVDYDEDEEWAYGYFYSESEQLSVIMYTYYSYYGDIVFDLYAYGIDYVTGISVSGDPSENGEAVLGAALEEAGWELDDRYATSLGNLAIFDTEEVKDLKEIPYMVYFNEDTYMNAFSLSIMPMERTTTLGTLFPAEEVAVFGITMPELEDWGVWSETDNTTGVMYIFGFDSPAIVGEGETKEELDVNENYLAIYNTITAENSGWVLVEEEAEAEEEEAEEDDDDTGPLTLAADDNTGPLDDEEEEIPTEFIAYSKNTATMGAFIEGRLVIYVISGSYYTEIYFMMDIDVNGTLANMFTLAGVDEEVIATIPDFFDGTKNGSISLDYSGKLTLSDPNDEAKLGLLEKEFIELFDEDDWDVEHGADFGEWTITSKNATGDKIQFKLSYDRENRQVLIGYKVIPENNE